MKMILMPTEIQRVTANAVLTVVISLIIYFLLQILIVDVTEELVKTTVQAPNADVAASLNYITWAYILNILFASYAANALFYDVSALRPALLATVSTISSIYIVSFLSFTILYPTIQLSWIGIISLPTIFLSYVVRDISITMLFVLAFQVSFFIVYDQIINVE